MSFWPLYRESLVQGPSHVSLSLPGKPSMISKSIGGVNPALLMIPNIEFLTAFINGNIGVGDATIKGMIHTALNQPFMKKDPKMIENYLDTLDLKIPDLSKFKLPSGEVNIPLEEIQVPDIFKDTGIKALEKTIITSIFETQKPYIEIIKLILNAMVSIEDIIARIMPLLALNPLKSKSEKPIVKDGSSNGTKAIGYQNGIEFKKAIAELDKLSKLGLDISIDKDGNFSGKKKDRPATKTDQPLLGEKDLAELGKKWEVIGTVYSTGDFDPTVEYEYSYIYLPEDEKPEPPVVDTAQADDNPYDKYKPKRIILGIFHKDGTPLDPRSKLKNSNFMAADWITKTSKWKFRDTQYIWPSFGSGTTGSPVFVWRNAIGLTRESKESPGDKWQIKKYKEGDKNLINKDVDAIPDDPMIARFETADTLEYLNYFTDFIVSKMRPSKDLSEQEKAEVLADLLSKLDVQSHLQNVYLYGSGPNSVYNGPAIPELLKKSFKPYQIYVPEAAQDPELSGDGLVWVDPEADYDMKIIKVEVSKTSGAYDIKPKANANDHLITEELFSTGKYGSGTDDSPQELGMLSRYGLTEADTETYYIIEGTYVENKTAFESGADASGDDGKRWYRLPHAIGAVIPFIKLLIDFAIKLFPTINKLLKLFKDPTGMITDIIKEKIGEAFTMFGEPAFDKFKKVTEIMGKKKEFMQKGDISKYTDEIKKNFAVSPLKNFMYVDEISPVTAGKFDFVLDGVAMIPFSIFGRTLPFGLELKMGNLVPEVPNINIPEVPKIDVPKIPDPNINVSANVSTPSLPTGLPSTGTGLAGAGAGLAGAGAVSGSVTLPKTPEIPKVAVPNVGIPSITLPKVKSPFRLIKGKIGKSKVKDCDNTPADVEDKGKSNSDYASQLSQQINKTDGTSTKGSKNPNGYYVDSIWYSTGEYINGVDYTYYYIKEDTAALLKEIDELVKPGSTNILMNPNTKDPSDTTSEDATPEDLQLAKDKLENALTNDPNNEVLQAKLKEIMDKLTNAMLKDQPIIKLVLGIVSTPIKIISCIVQWLLDFFKSLLNPMQLPAKIIELLSFKWIMKFFSTEGLLKTFGVNFNPAIVKEWISLASIPNANIDLNCGKLGGKLSGGLADLKLGKVNNLLPNTGALSGAAGSLTGAAGNLAGSATGALSGAAGSLSGSVGNLAGSATGALSGAAGSLSGVAGNLMGAAGSFKGIDLKAPGLGNTLKNLKAHCGSFMLPDDFPLANLPKFLSLPFMPNLPEYSSFDIKINDAMTGIFGDSILCLIEKFINAFIDFIWSIMGIEVVIKPPHIKLCKKKSPQETNKLNNGETDTDSDGTEVESTVPYTEKPTSNAFVYEVTFEDGTKQIIRDYESLQKFIDENKDISFDLQI